MPSAAPAGSGVGMLAGVAPLAYACSGPPRATQLDRALAQTSRWRSGPARATQLGTALALVLLLAVAAMPGRSAPTGTAPAAEDPPIEITADQLTVRQTENLAIFTGEVDAVQGEVSLKTDLLRVFYTSTEGETPGGTGTDVERLEAEGNVLVTRPDRTARGQRGIYNLVTRKVVLIGNVVLTNAGNIVTGERLDWDLATDVAVVTPAATGAANRDQRVRALFGAQPSPAAPARPGAAPGEGRVAPPPAAPPRPGKS